jgi:hemoglobin
VVGPRVGAGTLWGMKIASRGIGGTLYDAVGGDQWFVDLVDRFYDGVAADPLLRPLYPEEDLAGARHRLTGFLIQYWGGPTTYSEERGHPRLRMRHVPFSIGPAERDAWLRHMTAAVRAGGLEPPTEAAVLEYFAMAADHLVNAPT